MTKKMTSEIIEKLIDIVGAEQVTENADMAAHTSFKAGGAADVLVEPGSAEELKQVLAVLAGAGGEGGATEAPVPHMVLGNGSNVLVKDGGYRGVIVKIGKAFDYVRIEGDCLVCGAGTLMSVVAKAAASAGLAGFEFASGIPGSIGGAVFMNAGAYEGEIKNILRSVKAISSDGSREFTTTAQDLDMGYRHTALHESGDVVVEAVLKLDAGEETAIREKMAELAQKRNSKQPVQYPSAGSFFKRPEGYFAGKLVQDAGCKGLSVGGAEVSTLHSGFIINKGGATATDILQLKELVQARVMDQFGVMLQPEVRIIGEDPAGTAAGSGSGTGVAGAADTVDAAGQSADFGGKAVTEINGKRYRMLYDLHTHTPYSHGKGTVEENVRAAFNKGLEYVAISDHGPGHIFYGVNRNDFPNIRNDIDKMSIKYQSLNVRNSIEANILHAKGKNSNGLDVRPDEFDQFDFVIAGFHFGCFGCSSIRNWLWCHGIKAGEEALRESNTKMVTDALRLNDIAILTHPGDKGPFDILEIAKVCAETNTLIEINSHHGHLSTDEIKIAMQVPGLNFIISSDAHVPEAVGSFEESLQRALDAGLEVSRIVNIREE